LCGYGYGVPNADPWLYRNPYCGITGLYGYEVKIFILIILKFYILHEWKSDNYVKDFICFRSAHRPFAPVWSGPLTLESSLSYLSLSLALAVSHCHRQLPLCHHSVTTRWHHSVATRWHYRRHRLGPALCCAPTGEKGCHVTGRQRLPALGGGEGGRQGRGMRRSETK
jgi:hypothetical protein